MKDSTDRFRSILIAAVGIVAVVIAGGCTGLKPQSGSGSFASVRPVIESNCVHCHGRDRLAQMPPFTDTRALASLIGPAGWIVPGHPERSRFFQVVAATDQQPGAMPPTGHAISRSDVAALRAWISAGAPVPQGAQIVLTPRGEGPRSQ